MQESDAYRIGRQRLEFARRATVGLLDDLPAEQWLHQPVEGGNHVSWILGHLAANDDLFRARLSGQPSPPDPDWMATFGRGSRPRPEAAHYPSADEIRERFDRSRADLMSWFAEQDQARLLEPLPAELQPLAFNACDLMASLAWHEGWHAGQIAVVRHSLGLSPRFG